MILLLDDEENILRSLSRALRSAGVEIVTFSDPYKALDYLKENSVEIVISDFRMQKQNGIAFLVEVKIFSPNSKRIILSGYADEQLIKKSIEDETVHGYWLKPMKVDEILSKIQNLKCLN